jgi:endonuclease G
MKERILLFFMLVGSACTIAFSQQEATTLDGRKVLLYSDSTWSYTDSDPLYNIKTIIVNKLEIPRLRENDFIITHTGYSLSYNELHEQASWVAYELTAAECDPTIQRTDKFIVDPQVKTRTANDKDYSESGYDRGHLAPAGDMAWSTVAMSESFYYSNVSPQDPGFNRGIWKRVEELVRNWAIESRSVYVVTGPVLTTGLLTIGPNSVSVPKYFYKVVLDYQAPGIKSIGFILPGVGSRDQLQSFAVSVDSVEKTTGIDFFPSLPDDQEDIIESIVDIRTWTWKSSRSSNENKENLTTSIQCNGTTKKGERCRNRTLNIGLYCYLHESQMSNTDKTVPITPSSETKSKSSSSVQCAGTTKKGARCRNITTNASGRCYLH